MTADHPFCTTWVCKSIFSENCQKSNQKRNFADKRENSEINSKIMMHLKDHETSMKFSVHSERLLFHEFHEIFQNWPFREHETRNFMGLQNNMESLQRVSGVFSKIAASLNDAVW